MPVPNSKQVQARELKHRVLTCLQKLSDRDTHSAAASELESIARNLPVDALSSFLSSISATDASDKSPVRRQCLRLVSVLSENHGNSLSPHLSKILFSVVRRLRDPDSSVRSACVAASLSLSSHITDPPFTSITKPFIDALFLEQDINTQNGAALCLAAIIEGSRNVDVGSLRRLAPRLLKLAKCDSFKSKPSLLMVIGTVIGVNQVLNHCGKNVIKNLIACLMEFLNCDDWASRKAAAEALTKLAGTEKEPLLEYKASCLKTFESKRFDKVKAAREAMNLMIEAWKEIPDQPDEVSLTPESQSSSTENASDDRSPPISKTSIVSTAPPVKKISSLGKLPSRTLVSDFSPASTARKSTSVGSENKRRRAIFRKLDFEQPLSKCNDETAVPHGGSGSNLMDENGDTLTMTEGGKQFEKPDDKADQFDDTGEFCLTQRECEGLSLIREQLLQIENQQSHLLELLQKLMGTSQDEMCSLEARVRGVELALDEISLSLAISKDYAAGTTCCTFPGAQFLTSKLWKTDCRSSTSQLPASHGITSEATAGRSGRNADAGGLGDRRYELHGGNRLLASPWSNISRGSLEIPDSSSNRLMNNVAPRSHQAYAVPRSSRYSATH